MLKIFTLTAFALPGLGMAQDILPPMDLAGLFALHADDVIESEITGFQTLALPGEVSIERRGTEGQYEYMATDKSKAGAVGCALEFFIYFKAYQQVCPAMVTESQELDTGLERITTFYANNYFPPLSSSDVVAFTELRIVRLANRKMAFLPRICVEDSAESQGYGYLVDEGISIYLDSLLDVARLPVINPCL